MPSRLGRAGRVAAGVFVVLASPGLAEQARRSAVRSVAVEGTQFKITTVSGKVMRSADLVGAVLGVKYRGRIVRVRIDGLERDPKDRSGETWLHAFQVQRTDKTWAPLCYPDAEGARRGFPLAGHENKDGTISRGEPGEFQIVCTSDAEGKCTRIGYHSWGTAPNGAPMLGLHNACVRLIRADYAGRNQPTTREGTVIDIYDRWGLQASQADPAYAFEAGWDERGAVCVNHPRIAQNVTLAQIEVSNPRLRGRTGAICTRAFATRLGAVLFNGSRPEPPVEHRRPLAGKP